MPGISPLLCVTSVHRVHFAALKFATLLATTLLMTSDANVTIVYVHYRFNALVITHVVLITHATENYALGIAMLARHKPLNSTKLNTNR